MRKVLGFFLLLILIKSYAQDFNQVSYFYNLSYNSPAFQNVFKTQVDVHSNSLYSNLPVGVSSYHLSAQQQINDQIGVSGLMSNSTFGKAQSIFRVDLSVQYKMELGLKGYLSGGLGIKSFRNKYDETQLQVDYNENERTTVFGTDQFTENSLLIPFGLEFKSRKMQLGSYYGVGLGKSPSYGVYGRRLVLNKTVKELAVRDIVSVGFYQQSLNPKLEINNKIEIENFGLSLFLSKDFRSDAIRANTSIGAGVFYLWKTFNINYQLATNQNNLGLSHLIGLQLYLP